MASSAEERMGSSGEAAGGAGAGAGSGEANSGAGAAAAGTAAARGGVSGAADGAGDSTAAAGAGRAALALLAPRTRLIARGATPQASSTSGVVSMSASAVGSQRITLVREASMDGGTIPAARGPHRLGSASEDVAPW